MRARSAAATFAMLLAGCGDGLGPPDAPLAADADVGLVRVQKLGGVLDGNTVVFQDADSTAVLVTHTDDAGRANAYMRPGGFVTITGQNGSAYLIYTWTGVQPGDQLVLDRRAATDTGLATSFAMSAPTNPPDVKYQAHTSCGVAPLEADLDGQRARGILDLHRCEPATDVLVTPGAFGDAPRAYLYAADVPVPAGASGSATLAGSYQPLDTATVATSDSGGSASATVTQSLFDHHNREVYRAPEISAPLGAVQHAMPLASRALLVTSVRFEPEPSSLGVQHTVQWGPPVAITTVDAGTTLRRYTAPPTYDPAQHALVWAEDGGGALADVVVGELGWFRPATGEQFTWQVVAPRTAEPRLVFPRLPDAALAPTGDDALPSVFTLANVRVEGGYDRVRAHLLGMWAIGAPWPMDGSAGSVSYEALR